MSRRRRAFTLVELLVVVAIIATLLALLLPAMSKARQTAIAIVCRSNLRQVSTMMHTYANEYVGVMPQGAHAGDPPWKTDGGVTHWTHFLSHAGYDAIEQGQANASNEQAGYLRCPLLQKRLYAIYVDGGANVAGEFSTEPYGQDFGFTFNGLRRAQLPSPSDYAHGACGKRTDGGGGQLPPDEPRAASAFRAHKWFNAGGQRDAIWMGHLGRTNIIFADGHVEGSDPDGLLTTSNYNRADAIGNRGIDAYWDANGTYVDLIP